MVTSMLRLTYFPSLTAALSLTLSLSLALSLLSLFLSLPPSLPPSLSLSFSLSLFLSPQPIFLNPAWILTQMWALQGYLAWWIGRQLVG